MTSTEQKFIALPRFERGAYAEAMVSDTITSTNYFIHGGSSWTMRPRIIGVMEKFYRQVCFTISFELRKRLPDAELLRLFRSLKYYCKRYKESRYHNL